MPRGRRLILALLRGTPTPTVNAAIPAPSLATAQPATAAAPAATPAPSAATSIQAASGDVVLPILAALVIVVVVSMFVLRRSRRA